MKEIIKKIEEVENLKSHGYSDYGSYDGYRLTTNKQDYFLLIDNCPSCCESFGYICSEDSLEDFIGSELLSIETVDTALNKNMLVESDDEGEYMFVNVETNKGLLQFAVYNSHNGYYGHTVLVKVTDAVEDHTL